MHILSVVVELIDCLLLIRKIWFHIRSYQIHDYIQWRNQREIRGNYSFSPLAKSLKNFNPNCADPHDPPPFKPRRLVFKQKKDNFKFKPHPLNKILAARLTINININSFFYLTFSIKTGQCEASTICGEKMGSGRR